LPIYDSVNISVESTGLLRLDVGPMWSAYDRCVFGGRSSAIKIVTKAGFVALAKFPTFWLTGMAD
jgi:hypothetical protein